MDDAPKNRPIIVYYDHDADPYYDGDTGKLTDYGANAETNTFLKASGITVAMWCDGYHDDDGWGSESYWVPGCWCMVQNDDYTDVICNPIFWAELSDIIP